MSASTVVLLSAIAPEIMPNLKDGARIAIEITETFEKSVRVASTDFSAGLHVYNDMDTTADLQDEEVQLDLMMGGNMAYATAGILEQAISLLETTETVQTLHYSMVTLDVLVMKLLEVQKGGLTEETYERLQNTTLRAIVITPPQIYLRV